MIEAVVFDFDGVLVNSEPLHLTSYQEVFAALGVTLTREDYYANYLGFDDEGVFRTMAAAQGWQMDDRQIAALVSQKSAVFDERIAGGGPLYPGAAACIARLAAVFPLGIASGSLTHEIRTVLELARLDHHFRFIVGSGDTPNSKPAPDPYLRAAALHRLPPESCVAIEDSRWGIVSAKTAGMKCVGITNTYPAAELEAADTVIASLDDFTADLIARL